MSQDSLYTNHPVQDDFSFNDQVAEVFDDMLTRSIPFYTSVIDAIAQLFIDRIKPGFTIYDLGCSTGTTLLELSRRLPQQDIEFIGIDNAAAMLEKARRKSDMFSKKEHLKFIEGDITSCELPGADGIICNYTLQFLRPMQRLEFVTRLWELLPPQGMLILSEKTISHASRLNRDFIEIYHRFKRKQGYSELEIAQKREALENVLIPFSLQENVELLHQAGFTEVEIFFKWFNFASFAAIKR